MVMAPCVAANGAPPAWESGPRVYRRAAAGRCEPGTARDRATAIVAVRRSFAIKMPP